MNAKVSQLERRRAALVSQAAQERQLLSVYYAEVQRPVRVAEQAFGVFKVIRSSPFLITAVCALLLKTPWRRLAKLPRVAWSAWKVLQTFRRFV